MDKLNVKTEVQFPARLATNLKNIILKEGPEIVIWKDIYGVDLGRNFMWIYLGGVKYKADIRGYRRTYIGSMSGHLIDGLKVKVFLL